MQCCNITGKTHPTAITLSQEKQEIRSRADHSHRGLKAPRPCQADPIDYLLIRRRQLIEHLFFLWKTREKLPDRYWLDTMIGKTRIRYRKMQLSVVTEDNSRWSVNKPRAHHAICFPTFTLELSGGSPAFSRQHMQKTIPNFEQLIGNTQSC